MDAINNIGIRLPAPVPAAIQKAPSAPVPVKPEPVELPDVVDVAAARDLAVKQAAEVPANPYPVSDKTFALFRDATGQMITRVRSLRDGKITYFPEPQLFKAGAPVDPSLLNIKA